MNNNFKNLPTEEKPRERLKKYGRANLSNEELLSIILKTGTHNVPVDELSKNLLVELKSITNLKDITLSKLTSIKGIGEVKALSLYASIELGRRIFQSKPLTKKYNISNPIDIINYYNDILKDKLQEEFHVLYLDSNNTIISSKRLFIGTINRSIVHPREIFKEAYLNSACKIVCIHNHPSGSVTPSKEDIMITKSLDEIGRIHDIKLVDHLIIGLDKYFSFYENKYLKN